MGKLYEAILAAKRKINESVDDMSQGIGLPYHKDLVPSFRAVAAKLGMKEGSPQYSDPISGEYKTGNGDYFFEYERGDTPETADPASIFILNPTMQNNPEIQKLVQYCIAQYD